MKSAKVFWSDAEKAKIVSRAVELRPTRPDLAGLSLLRAAMAALPANRRRKVVALSQVPWFEEWVAAEVRTAELQGRVDEELAPIFKNHFEHHIEWRAQHMAALNRHEKLLELILRDLDLLVERRLADEKEQTGSRQA